MKTGKVLYFSTNLNLVCLTMLEILSLQVLLGSKFSFSRHNIWAFLSVFFFSVTSSVMVSVWGEQTEKVYVFFCFFLCCLFVLNVETQSLSQYIYLSLPREGCLECYEILNTSVKGMCVLC